MIQHEEIVGIAQVTWCQGYIGPHDLRAAAVSVGMKWDINSLPRNWTWVSWMKTRNPSHQTSEHDFAASEKCISHRGKIVNASKKFIGDIAQQQVEEHTEKSFV